MRILKLRQAFSRYALIATCVLSTVDSTSLAQEDRKRNDTAVSTVLVNPPVLKKGFTIPGELKTLAPATVNARNAISDQQFQSTSQPSAATQLAPPSTSRLSAYSNATAGFARTRGAVLEHRRVIASPTKTLDFGGAVVGTGGGTITVAPSGSVRTSGAVVLIPNAPVSEGKFSMNLTQQTGLAFSANDQMDDSENMSIVLPSEIYLQSASSSEKLLVDQFTYELKSNVLSVGATIHLKPYESAGDFRGSYLIMLVCD